MKALVHQEFTLINSFTWLWPRIISYVGIFVDWGRLLNAVLKFLVRLVVVYSLFCGRE